MENIITDLCILEEPSSPLEFITDTGVTKDEGIEIIEKIKGVMKENEKIIALAAPQIGIKKRVFCIRFDDTIKTFINPIITKKDGINIFPETLVNLPNKEILIARPKEISVVYYTDEFKYEDNKLLGAAAQIFDQQCQLLDGILPTELGLVSDIEEDGSLYDCTESEMEELVEIYKKFITIKTKAFESAITEEEQNTYKKLKFMEKVINGKAQISEELKRPANREQRRKAEKISREVNKKRKK